MSAAVIPANFKGAAAPRTPDGIAAAAVAIGCEPIMVQAVIDVETSGAGFRPDSRPKILCERHRFSALTSGRFDDAYPDISNPVPGGYLGAAAEYSRLARMVALSHDAALEATSWGLPQIMGCNHVLAGYADVTSMVADFCGGENAQLAAFARFIVQSGMAEAMRAQDAADFARRYNGPDYAVNDYDGKIVADLARLRAAASTPPNQTWPAYRIAVQHYQAALNLAGYGPLETDGWDGAQTTLALRRFQIDTGLPPIGLADPATLSALGLPSA